MLGGLEEDVESASVCGDVDAEGDFAVGVEGLVESAEDAVFAYALDAEDGAIACVVVDAGLSGLGSVDGDGAGVGCALGDVEGCFLAGDEVFDEEIEAGTGGLEFVGSHVGDGCVAVAGVGGVWVVYKAGVAVAVGVDAVGYGGVVCCVDGW